MDNKRRYLTYIDGDYSLDFWSDVAVVHAIELANKLSSEEWRSLEHEWLSQKQRVQVRIAETASEVVDWCECIGKMLLRMVRSDDLELIEASVDSLNSVYQSAPERLAASDLKQALDSLQLHSPVSQVLFESLAARVAGD